MARTTAGTLVVLALLALVLPVLVQSGGLYDLSWNTVDGGGYTFSTGQAYTLGGTAGQADAGLLAGGAYTLGGGLWGGGELAGGQHRVYLPMVTRKF
jgi:hypothetical protein